MALSTPTINKIDVFDATKEFEFEFSYSGTQAVKNRLVIRKDIYDTCFCNILYDEAKVDISLLSISNIRYCKLKATEDNSIYVIYKELTDSSATHTKDSIINFEIHRINGIFSLKAYYA